MNRREIFHSQNDMDRYRSDMANSKESYAEDHAFMARMEVKPFRDWNKAEQQRLWRIAKRGLSVRRGLYGHISDIEMERVNRISDGSINGGYRVGVIIDKQLSILKEIVK